jgi:hypothetical protein
MDVGWHAPFTKSPLDEFRGAGRARARPHPSIRPHPTPAAEPEPPKTAVDIAGNVVPLAPEKKKPGRKKKVVDHTVKVSTEPVTIYFK